MNKNMMSKLSPASKRSQVFKVERGKDTTYEQPGNYNTAVMSHKDDMMEMFISDSQTQVLSGRQADSPTMHMHDYVEQGPFSQSFQMKRSSNNNNFSK